MVRAVRPIPYSSKKWSVCALPRYLGDLPISPGISGFETGDTGDKHGIFFSGVGGDSSTGFPFCYCFFFSIHFLFDSFLFIVAVGKFPSIET